MTPEAALIVAERERDEAIARHAADQQRWEERRREDQHHFRNVLAVIRAMVRRAGDDAASVEVYCGQLDGRIAAYIHAQAVVARDGEADLESMIADELLRFGIRLGETADLAGDPVAISGQAAGLLALLFHEIAADLTLVDADSGDRCFAAWWRPDADGWLTVECVSVLGSARVDDDEGSWVDWVRQALRHQVQIEVKHYVAGPEQTVILRIPPERTSTR